MALEEIDGRAIRAGITVAAGIAAPAGVAQFLLDDRFGAQASAPLGLVILLAFAAGGYRAGTLSPARPMTDGALSAMLAFVAVQTAFLVLGALGAGDGINAASIVFSGLLATSSGIVGGQVGSMRRRRAGRTQATDEPKEQR